MGQKIIIKTTTTLSVSPGGIHNQLGKFIHRRIVLVQGVMVEQRIRRWRHRFRRCGARVYKLIERFSMEIKMLE